MSDNPYSPSSEPSSRTAGRRRERKGHDSRRRFALKCQCGQVTGVTVADAGTIKTCLCGSSLEVPSLREIRTLDVLETQADPGNSLNDAIVVAIIVVGFVVVSLASYALMGAAGLMFVGWLTVFAGKFWFLVAMLNEMGAKALLVFAIPFFDWLFLFIRLDVAWKPVLVQMIGLALCCFAAPLPWNEFAAELFQ